VIRLIFLLVVLVGAVWLGIKVAADPGYALLSYRQWTMEMPLWFAGLVLIIGFICLYILVRLLRGAGLLAKYLGKWRRHRHATRSYQQTMRGLLRLAEGRWQLAEKFLNKGVEYNKYPLINYLGAARAAQELGAHDRRDRYLCCAHEMDPDAELAIGLTRAQLQFNHSQLEHSLASLHHIQHLAPNHHHVLKLLKELYIKLRDWKGLLNLLPALRKNKVFESDVLQSLEQQAYRELIFLADKFPEQYKLEELWQSMPRSIRRDNSILHAYVEILIKHKRNDEAESLLRESLKSSLDVQLVTLYGTLQSSHLIKQLATAEKWLKHSGNSPALLLCLGQLCIKSRLWGKARSYLEKSIELEKNCAAYKALGDLLQQLGETEEALSCYKEGLEYI